MSDAWSNGLCSCTNNCTNFLIACCVPCGLHYMHAKATERATNNGTSCMTAFLLDLCHCWCLNRTKIREAYGIQGSLIGDCVTMYFCLCCAALQDINEVAQRSQQPIC